MAFTFVLTLVCIPKVSLAEAISRALQLHPSVRRAEAERDKATGEFQSQRAGALPRVDIAGSHLWVEATSVDGHATRVSLSSSLAAARLTLPLVNPRAWAEWAEAGDDLEVALHHAHASKRQVALSAARAWVRVLSLHHVIDARTQAQITAKAHQAYVQGRIAHGASNQLELVRAKRERIAIEALMEKSNADLARAQELLGVSMGSNEPVDAAGEPQAAGEWPLGQARPDVEAATLRAHASKDEADHTYTDYLPMLDLQAQAFIQDVPTPALPVSGVGAIVMLVLSVPIYDGGRREGRREERRATAAALEAESEAAHRAAEAEKRTGIEDLARARSAWDKAREQAALARSALTLTQDRFDAGAGTDLDVIDALREARDADIAVAVAENAVRLASIDVLAATGNLTGGSL